MTAYDEGPEFSTYRADFDPPVLPRVLRRNSFLPWMYGGFAVVTLLLAAYAASDVLDFDGDPLLSALLLLGLIALDVGVWAALSVPDLRFRVTLLPDGVSLRTWRGERTVAYADVRVVRVYLRNYRTGSSRVKPMMAIESAAGAEEVFLYDSEEVDPDERERIRAESEAEDAAGVAPEALDIELVNIELDDRVLMARVVEQQARGAYFDEPGKRLLAGVQPTRSNLD